MVHAPGTPLLNTTQFIVDVDTTTLHHTAFDNSTRPDFRAVLWSRQPYWTTKAHGGGNNKHVDSAKGAHTRGILTEQ